MYFDVSHEGGGAVIEVLSHDTRGFSGYTLGYVNFVVPSGPPHLPVVGLYDFYPLEASLPLLNTSLHTRQSIYINIPGCQHDGIQVSQSPFHSFRAEFVRIELICIFELGLL